MHIYKERMVAYLYGYVKISMKNFKKLASVLLAVAMIFALSVVANAASTSVTARANKTNVSAGDTVTVTVSLNQNPGIAGVDFELNYDSSKFELQNVTKGSAASNFDMASANSTGSSIRGAYLNSDGSSTSSTGALATVTFKVISDSASTASIGISASSTNGNGDGVETYASGTSVKIVTTTATTKPETTTKKETTTKETTTKETENTTKIIPAESIGVKVGNTYQLAKPASMQGKVVFSSSNSAVVTVDNSGIIRTLAKGTVTIKAVSENGITKTWVLLVGDGSTVEGETTDVTEEGETTEIPVIGEVEDSTEETTKKEREESKKKLDNSDETFRLIVGVGAAVAVLVVIVIVASMIRKRRSFADRG